MTHETNILTLILISFGLLKRKGLVKTRCEIVCVSQSIQIFLLHRAYAKEKEEKKNIKQNGASRIIARLTTSSLGIPHMGKKQTQN